MANLSETDHSKPDFFVAPFEVPSFSAAPLDPGPLCAPRQTTPIPSIPNPSMQKSFTPHLLFSFNHAWVAMCPSRCLAVVLPRQHVDHPLGSYTAWCKWAHHSRCVHILCLSTSALSWVHRFKRRMHHASFVNTSKPCTDMRLQPSHNTLETTMRASNHGAGVPTSIAGAVFDICD